MTPTDIYPVESKILQPGNDPVAGIKEKLQQTGQFSSFYWYNTVTVIKWRAFHLNWQLMTHQFQPFTTVGSWVSGSTWSGSGISCSHVCVSPVIFVVLHIQMPWHPQLHICSVRPELSFSLSYDWSSPPHSKAACIHVPSWRITLKNKSIWREFAAIVSFPTQSKMCSHLLKQVLWRQFCSYRV